jgi:hypothetical protein
MSRRFLFLAIVATALVGTSVLGGTFGCAATTKYHLLVHTVDSENAQHGKYVCGMVSTLIDGTSLIEPFTVSVVNSKGKVVTSAGGTVTASVSPLSSESACLIQSLDVIKSFNLSNGTVPVIHGVATFTSLNATQPGSYVIVFSDSGIINTGPKVLLTVVGPNTPSSGGSAQLPSGGDALLGVSS